MNIKINYKRIGKVLAKYRLQANLTQREAAEELGLIGPQFISNIERGLCPIPLKTLKDLLKIYKLDRTEKDALLNVLILEHEKVLRYLLR